MFSTRWLPRNFKLLSTLSFSKLSPSFTPGFIPFSRIGELVPKKTDKFLSFWSPPQKQVLHSESGISAQDKQILALHGNQEIVSIGHIISYQEPSSMDSPLFQLSSILKKRKQKMRNHKHKKRRRKNRFKSKK